MNILFPYMARWKSINWTRYHNLFTEFAKRGHNIYIIQPPSLKFQKYDFYSGVYKYFVDKFIKLLRV